MDIGRFEEASKEIEEVLGTKLYAVATHPGQLDECFYDAQGLVESTSVLLGCPGKEINGCAPSKHHACLGHCCTNYSSDFLLGMRDGSTYLSHGCVIVSEIGRLLTLFTISSHARWWSLLFHDRYIHRFRNKIGAHPRIGNYVATVSRLNLLWTAVCGVVEIVRMIRQRRELVEVSDISGHGIKS